MNIYDAYDAALAAVLQAETAAAQALAAAQTYAAAVAAATDPATVAASACNAAALTADAAARQVSHAAATLFQAVQDLPADAADAVRQAAADALSAVQAAARWAFEAATSAAQTAIPGGAPVVGLGGVSGGAGASGAWAPQIRRHDRRLHSNYWACDILQRQYFWRITWQGQQTNYWLPSWRVRSHWAWASLSAVSRLIERPCANFTESWSAELASAFARWSEDRAAWQSTDSQMDVWRAESQDANGIPAQDSPAWIDAQARDTYAGRVTVVAPNTPVYSDDGKCTVTHYTDVQRATPPADRLVQRGIPQVTHYTYSFNPLWGTMYEGWYIRLPKITRIYWFFPPIVARRFPGSFIHFPPLGLGGETGGGGASSAWGVNAAKPQWLDDEVDYE